MDLFKMMKEAAAMRSKLAEMEKLLKEKIIEVEKFGIRIKINAKSDILDLKILPEVLKQDKEKIEKDIFSAVTEAIRKSRDIMAEEAKRLTGDLKIPGMM